MKPIAVVMLFLSLLWALPAQALPVDGLYREEVPVSGQSQQERTRAYREGLERVIVKVSGQREALEDSRIRTALGRAADYVEEVSYRTGMRPLTLDELDIASPGQPASVQQAYLDVRFAPDLIDSLLRDARVPIWDRNRPTVLVWLVVEEESGRRQVLGSGSDHPAIAALRRFSRERAIPMLVPILDLQDRRALPVDEAWRLGPERLREASARYGADSILAGRVLEVAPGEYAGLWQFIFRDQESRFDHFAEDIGGFMDAPLDRVTVELAQHFALDAETLAREEDVTLRVDGVRNLDIHAGLMEYIESLSIVQQAHVARLQHDRIELRVRVAGGAGHLADFISLDRDLEAVDTSDVQAAGLLHYRWTR